MSILRKRISAILLSLAMVTAVALPTFADDTQSYTPMQISAESEAFPQAYIEIENGTTLMARDGTTHLSGASVTVYYEEHYKYDSQGNLFITDSRLLSEDEVNAIGKENFDEGAPSLTREVSNTRGKLTIRMDGSYSTSGNSLTAFFSAMSALAKLEKSPIFSKNHCTHMSTNTGDCKDGRIHLRCNLVNCGFYTSEISLSSSRMRAIVCFNSIDLAGIFEPMEMSGDLSCSLTWSLTKFF